MLAISLAAKVLLFLFFKEKKNATTIFKSDLEKFMLDFSMEYFDKGIAPKFDPIGVYNNFNPKRINHRNVIIKLRDEIRKYLMIDKPR